ncbi:hypothetical protein ACUHMQ_20085, partial [Chitinimonas sp. PSY-7]|uniref:hypothetical protein n=1 Tax=Chitinimonas sp. PSY-7 TaxID=3459088 RepID=UPI0040403C50
QLSPPSKRCRGIDGDSGEFRARRHAKNNTCQTTIDINQTASKSGEQLLIFCRRDIYAMDIERALLAVGRRETAARKEEPSTPSWPGPVEQGLAAMVRKHSAVRHRVNDRRI